MNMLQATLFWQLLYLACFVTECTLILPHVIVFSHVRHGCAHNRNVNRRKSDHYMTEIHGVYCNARFEVLIAVLIKTQSLLGCVTMSICEHSEHTFGRSIRLPPSAFSSPSTYFRFHFTAQSESQTMWC